MADFSSSLKGASGYVQSNPLAVSPLTQSFTQYGLVQVGSVQLSRHTGLEPSAAEPWHRPFGRQLSSPYLQHMLKGAS